MSVPAKPLLSVRRLTVEYPQRRGTVRAVDDLHFNLHAGEALGIVGEAGAGKSTLARALVGLQPVTGGGMVYGGRDLARLDARTWQPVRRDIQLVFQDPVASLDPRLTIAASVEESIEALLPELDAPARGARAAAWLERVGLGADTRQRYPHELTPAQCRLAGFARALAVEPQVLVCDEPLAALGSEDGARVLALLGELQRERGLAMVIASRDFAAMRDLCQRVVVLYLGRVMEQGGGAELLGGPRHPYTRALLGVAPAQSGEAVDPANPPGGCVFRTRCPMADDLCARETPYLRRVSDTAHAACHYVHGGDPDDVEVREGVVGTARASSARPRRSA